MESDSSTEMTKESEEKKQKIQKKSANAGSVDISMVYALPHSFKVESVEYKESVYDGKELTVAQLQLEDAKAADAVVFEKPSIIQTRFVRPLFIRTLIEERPVGRVMVDGGAIVNVMPISFFKKLGKSENELKPTDTIMTDFTGNDSHYNLLLGRDWIHENEYVPSTLHGKLFQWIGDRVEEIKAEGRPQMVDINTGEIGYINWADAYPDQISFVRVTEDGVQLVLTKDKETLMVAEEPPNWLKWNIKSQEPKL
uniref:Uncharacterized protein n=1 Tax=Ananas comosus var. bracteatus TaxID=296719 RepID=A0A6V7NJL7_ANACO|nr:unnamed protein product [Ananas comosus var. bracteatus]